MASRTANSFEDSNDDDPLFPGVPVALPFHQYLLLKYLLLLPSNKYAGLTGFRLQARVPRMSSVGDLSGRIARMPGLR